MMRYMRFFTLQACIGSDIAQQKGIDNTPTPEVEACIVETVEQLLDPLSEAWEAYCRSNRLGVSGIDITSGYRCVQLNGMVGASSTSAHCRGYAFDLVPANGKMREFKRFCRDYLADKAFDQLISVEEDNGIPRWIHVGYKHPDGHSQRRQFISQVNGKYKAMTD